MIGHRFTLAEAESLAWLRELESESVDAVITDPPYSSGGFTRGDRMSSPSRKYVNSDVKIERVDFAGDNRDQRAYLAWCTLWLSECLRVAKPGAPIVLFTDWRQLPTTTDALQCGGWIWRGIVPWDKTEGVRPQMGRFASQCEYAVWGSRGAMEDRVDVGCLPGLVRESVRTADKHHVTGKPTNVMRFLARIAPPDGLILDPFAGSASTGVGALLEGRRFIGCEIVPAIASAAVERLSALAADVGLDEARAGQVGLFEGASDGDRR